MGEGGRDGAVEVVGVEAQLPELEQVGESGGESAAELETRQAELADSVLVTDDAVPVAGSQWGGRIPAVQVSQRVVEGELEGR